MSQDAFIDELMETNPAQIIKAFQEPAQTNSGNPNIYKTNPNAVTKENSPDGHYHCRVRIIYNPFDKSQSIVNNARYAFTDADGFFMADSKLAIGDKNCKIFKAWKSLHYSTDATQFEVDGKLYTKQEWGDHMFDKSEDRYCLVQVLEDVNQPDAVGKFKVMRLPKAIYDMLNAKMNPTDPKKAPQDLMNYLFGPALEMDVTPGPDDPQHPERKTREIKYNLCTFEADPSPITMVTGESLFTEDEIEMIMDYAEGKKVITNEKATAKKKAEAIEKCKSLVNDLKGLLDRALNYVKENAPNLYDEVGYHEPTEAQWARIDKWIDIVTNKLKDPKTYVEPNAPQVAKPVESVESSADEDLPF